MNRCGSPATTSPSVRPRLRRLALALVAATVAAGGCAAAFAIRPVAPIHVSMSAGANTPDPIGSGGGPP
jgi:hypothetical protein